MSLPDRLRLARFSAPPGGTVVCIGVFDGVHRGHQELLARCIAMARRRSAIALALSFDPHPIAFLQPQRPIQLVTLPIERADILRGYGIDQVLFASFDRAFAAQSPGAFVDEVLRRRLRAQAVVVGADYRFGRRGEGDAVALAELLGAETPVEVVPEVAAAGLRFRSSELRTAIAAGELDRVVALTGRPLSFCGLVRRGHGRGQKLGFATANLAVDDRQLLPKQGVYAVWAGLDGIRYPAVMNLGSAPTLRGAEVIAEVHLLDAAGDLYGQTMVIDCAARLRDEQHFPSADALVAQIQKDVAEAARLLRL